ncbi:unnamed protein product [Trichogramma brassicae]|uniref:JmjC domain-containing protein n=1 Tax=Trichogramma brassicae TaxID=86971 RepID=A0A6H5I049_9HYME|nr:unnamed protein product [Trichogramma brassicae]
MSMPKKTLRHHNIQVFRPTMEQFKDFNGLIKHMEEKGAHRAGIAKIIPPPEWKPRKDNYNHEEIDKIVIPVPIKQNCEGDNGLYFVYNCVRKPMTVSKFKQMCENNIKTPKDHLLAEKCYWKNLQVNSPTYGADVSGTITDDDCKYFNIAKLGTILDIVEQDYQTKIEGVNTAYLYFGMYRSMFPWHTEDMDLYSINYIHFGAPKTWYAIPPEHGRRFERLAAAFFPQEAAKCQSFLRHKSTVISLDNIEKYGIPYDTIIQKENEIIITFPYGYHAGFNHGYNCAESTNFATERWIDFGKRATLCCCKSSEDVVKICMKTFVQRFQPEKFDQWCAGLDDGRHPEHHERSFAGPESLRIVLDEKNRSHRLIPKGPILQEINSSCHRRRPRSARRRDPADTDLRSGRQVDFGHIDAHLLGVEARVLGDVLSNVMERPAEAESVRSAGRAQQKQRHRYRDETILSPVHSDEVYYVVGTKSMNEGARRAKARRSRRRWGEVLLTLRHRPSSVEGRS